MYDRRSALLIASIIVLAFPIPLLARCHPPSRLALLGVASSQHSEARSSPDPTLTLTLALTLALTLSPHSKPSPSPYFLNPNPRACP